MVADISMYSNKAGLHSNNTLDHQMFKFDGKLLISKAHPNYTVTPTADGKLEVKPIEEGSDTQMWTLEKASDTSANLLPATGKFALKNIGTGKTVGIEDVWYLTSGSCVEFTYHLDSDEVWGVLKPQGDHNNMVLDFYYRERVFGIWRKHGGTTKDLEWKASICCPKLGMLFRQERMVRWMAPILFVMTRMNNGR